MIAEKINFLLIINPPKITSTSIVDLYIIDAAAEQPPFTIPVVSGALSKGLSHNRDPKIRPDGRAIVAWVLCFVGLRTGNPMLREL
jgi:hypothetical protein